MVSESGEDIGWSMLKVKHLILLQMKHTDDSLPDEYTLKFIESKQLINIFIVEQIIYIIPFILLYAPLQCGLSPPEH